MEVTLTMTTNEEYISDNSKICYATKNKKNITYNLVHGNGHLAVLRFAYATVNIKDISIACQNQIVRSKHLDFLVESKRYVNADKGDFKFIYPKNINEEQKIYMKTIWETLINSYNTLIKNGVKKEDARAVLPMNTSTSMNITGNLQSWWDFFKLRLNNHAQLEVREVASKIFDLLQKEFPNVFTPSLKLELSN